MSTKSQGGLGVIDFHRQARLFKLRYVSQIISGHCSEWVQIVSLSIHQGLQRGPNKTELKKWTVIEFLLLLPCIKITSKVARNLLDSWKDVHHQLRFDAEARFPKVCQYCNYII
jgi:hypothetical protein